MGTPPSSQTAWRVNADTVPLMDFESYRESLIYETGKIKEFLAETRAEHFIISAPKGFGKTLLLIAKRKQLSEHQGISFGFDDDGNSSRSAITSSDGGEIVDRPSGPAPTFSKERISELKTDYFFWKNLWWISIMVAAFKADLRTTKRDIRREDLPCGKFLCDIIIDKNSHFTPMSIFTYLLNTNIKSQQQAIQGIRAINHLLVSIRTPVAYFLDNVDEYFKPFLQDQTLDKFLALDQGLNEDTQYRTKSNDIWIIAQISLVATAYDIHKTNKHIKVYCTVRHEALLRLNEYDADHNQILGCTIEIEYNKKDLLEIFKKNIALMDESKLSGSHNDDLVERYFGTDSVKMRHRFVDRSEDAFDYVLRHTFYRPRDLMMIGEKIATLEASERNSETIKTSVDRTSDELVKGLIKEMSPFFSIPNLKMLTKGIRTNVLSIEEVNDITTTYLDLIEARVEGGRGHIQREYSDPFPILYMIGMIGCIQTEFGKDMLKKQRFIAPREITIRNHAELPVTDGYFLIHPALDHIVSENAGGTYFNNFHRTNVIGNGVAWIAPDTSSFVLKGDVCGFTHVMTTEFYEEITKKMHEWGEESCRDIEFYEVTGGDSIVMIDKSADRVVRAAVRFINSAKAYREKPLTLRFGGAAGPVSYQTLTRRIQGKWNDITIPTGLALRTSARLEPHAPKGSLIVEEKFFDLIANRSDAIDISEISKDELKTLAFDDENVGFLVRKNSEDPPLKTKLFNVKLR